MYRIKKYLIEIRNNLISSNFNISHCYLLNEIPLRKLFLITV